jgi:hypothetical protein
VCNAKADAKPVIYDAEGNEVRQDPPKVCPENLILFTQTERNFMIATVVLAVEVSSEEEGTFCRYSQPLYRCPQPFD